MALVISRRVGERVIIDGKIVVEVGAIISGGRVKLLLSAPSDVPIAREELLEDDSDRLPGPKHKLINAMTNCV